MISSRIQIAPRASTVVSPFGATIPAGMTEVAPISGVLYSAIGVSLASALEWAARIGEENSPETTRECDESAPVTVRPIPATEHSAA